MTDNDDPAPPGDPPSFNGLGKNAPREGAPLPSDRRAIRWARRARSSAYFAPTDPEVPNAKRRGALRRQRSLVGLTAVVIGLLSITLALLYRASMSVGARDADDSGKPVIEGSRADTAVSPTDTVHGSTLTGLSPLPSVHSIGELGDEAPAEDSTSNHSAPAGSASTTEQKGPPPALDIIRTPAF
jgi:hypothetical protein